MGKSWFTLATCGVGIAIGACLPWVNMRSAESSGSLVGIEGQSGWLFVMGGLLFAGLAYFLPADRRTALFLASINLALSFFAVYKFTQARKLVKTLDEIGFIRGSMGVGIWMILAACAVAWLEVYRLMRSSRPIP